nr:hypothetical protein Iba_chr13bCG9600 [Ipomoea batatas]
MKIGISKRGREENQQPKEEGSVAPFLRLSSLSAKATFFLLLRFPANSGWRVASTRQLHLSSSLVFPAVASDDGENRGAAVMEAADGDGGLRTPMQQRLDGDLSLPRSSDPSLFNVGEHELLKWTAVTLDRRQERDSASFSYSRRCKVADSLSGVLSSVRPATPARHLALSLCATTIAELGRGVAVFVSLLPTEPTANKQGGSHPSPPGSSVFGWGVAASSKGEEEARRHATSVYGTPSKKTGRGNRCSALAIVRAERREQRGEHRHCCLLLRDEVRREGRCCVHGRMPGRSPAATLSIVAEEVGERSLLLTSPLRSPWNRETGMGESDR